MNILVIGSGGREHAIIRKLKESPKTEKLWCAPGNGGIAADAECVAINAMDIDGVVDFAKKNAVDLVFVAPDDPLAAGMVDALEKEGIRAFGPRANAAIIESSKVFSKNLMKKYGIPTADYAVFSDPKEVVEYVEKRGKFPVVIKADGLALGKGVIIAQNFDEAKGTDITSLPEFQQADVIHLHWINQGMLSLKNIEKILASGKPVVWTMHDMWPCTGICHHARECTLVKLS